MKDFLPENKCLSSLTETRTDVYFSAAARRRLFEGKTVSPVLEFDRTRFGVIRRELAHRISIPGIQDKISLRLEKNRLVPSVENGEYILLGNGDAHLKNFSLLESRDGDLLLSPAYDLVNTNVHFPNKSRLALNLFRNFESPQFTANGFYTLADFRELGRRYHLPPKNLEQTLSEFRHSSTAVEALINRSFLSEEARQRYLAIVADRLRALEIE